MKNMLIAELIFNRPLLIAEEKLNVILHVLGPRMNLDLSSMPAQEMAALSAREQASAGYSVQNGIATIGIYGPLMNRTLRSEFPSGGPTTYSDIRSSFDTALADDGVKEIKLEIDSPGGEVAGGFDLADHIYESRGIKPITAVVNEKALSGGYLLASAAGKIIMPRTALGGSVGVILTHADFSRAEDKAGITVTHITAGSKKAHFSPHQPLSAPALADANAGVQATYDIFVSTVARNRGISESAVRDTEAGIFDAKKCLELGLADEIMPVSKALGTRHVSSDMPMMPMGGDQQTATGGKASAGIQKGEGTMDKATLKEMHPALYAEVFGEGQKAAVDMERARVVGIMDMQGPGAKAHPGLLLEGIKSGASAGDVSLSIGRKEGELLSEAGKGIVEGAVKPAQVVDASAEGQQTAVEAGVEAILAGANQYNARR